MFNGSASKMTRWSVPTRTDQGDDGHFSVINTPLIDRNALIVLKDDH